MFIHAYMKNEVNSHAFSVMSENEQQGYILNGAEKGGGIRCLYVHCISHFDLEDVGGPLEIFLCVGGGPRTMMGNLVLDDLHACRYEDRFKVTIEPSAGLDSS